MTMPLADSGNNDRLVKLHPLYFDENADKIYLLFTFSVEYSNVEYLNYKIIKSVELMMLM